MSSIIEIYRRFPTPEAAAAGREQALTRASGMACCLVCRKEYYAGNEHGTGICWNCPKLAREGDYTQAQYDQAKAT